MESQSHEINNLGDKGDKLRCKKKYNLSCIRFIISLYNELVHH